MDDFDSCIPYIIMAEAVLFMSGSVVFWCFVCFDRGAVLIGDTIALVWKKHHGWHVFDTIHLFFLWTMHFKEGQDAGFAKCVPNKWYHSQNGSSLESVLAKGSKSMGLRQPPSSLRAGTHSRGTNGLSWLGSSKGLWPWASRLLGELESTSWAPKWGKIETKLGKNYNEGCDKQNVKGEKWGMSFTK